MVAVPEVRSFYEYLEWQAPTDGTYYIATSVKAHLTGPMTLYAFGNFDRYDPDKFESNDTMDEATDLGIEGINEHLTIHDSDDVDFFRFETRIAGSSFVHLESQRKFGTLRVELLSSDGEVLNSSIGVMSTDVEVGTYFIRVYSEAKANAYELTVGSIHDTTGDRKVNADDINRVCEHVRAESPRGDFNRDETVNKQDVDDYVSVVFQTTHGDANLDGQFDSSDLVMVSQAGEFEDDVRTTRIGTKGIGIATRNSMPSI